MSDAAPFFHFLDKYPVVSVYVFVTHTIASVPIAFLLYFAQIAPLHNNCRYILFLWTLSFGALFLLNCGLATLDFVSCSGHMPRSMYEPHIRFKCYQYLVMCTTFCSTVEIVLSIERIVAIVHPKRYHFDGFAWKTLGTITLSLMAFAYSVDLCVHNEKVAQRLAGCAIVAVVEITVLAAGGLALRVCRSKYRRMYGHATLTARYQVKEAFDMSKAMIPAYIISFIFKVLSISALGVYYAIINENNGYLTGYCQVFMITSYMCNGTFSIVNLLFKHPQLRKQVNRKFRSVLNFKPEEKTRSDSITDTETYFSLYTTSWK